MGGTSGRGRRAVTILGSLVVVGVAVGLVASLPRFVGASWSAIGASLGNVHPVVLLGLALLWFAGLATHVPVLQAAMPGLRARQALMLNLAGSSVSNVVPFGGPAGMGLGYAMTRSWGFGPDRFASYTVVTNLWNALGKFTASILILLCAAVLGSTLPSGLTSVVISASVFVLLAAGSAVLTFRTERSTVAVGRRLDAVRRRIRPHASADGLTVWLLNSRRELRTAVQAGWRRMSAGVLAYLCLQCALLFACLAAVGAGAPWTVVAVAFAVERLISLAPITPGAAGIAELGTIAALHSFGIDPVSAAAGVLLFRILMFAIEIPIGGTVALLWMRRASSSARAVPPPPEPGHLGPQRAAVVATLAGAGEAA